MNWKHLFREITLERGISYVRMGNVYNIKSTSKGYEAKVVGTNHYKVSIQIAKGEVEDMACTCFYAVNGSYCRHMVAVLYALEKRNEEMRNYKNSINLIFALGKNMEVELSKILYIDIPVMLQKGKFIAAFQMTKYLIDILFQYSQQNSIGELSQLITISYKIWEQFLENNIELKLKSELFYWMLDLYEVWDAAQSEGGLLDFIMNHFMEPKFLKEKLYLANRRIEQYKKLEDKNLQACEMSYWLMLKLEILAKLEIRGNTLLTYDIK